MPIIGLTDKQSVQAGAGLPLIGRIFKGSEKAANRPGKDLSHFRVALEPQFQHLQPVWDDLYGAEPTEFRIFLTAPTVDKAFPTWLEEWNHSGLLHRCDGHQQHSHMVNGQISHEKIACAAPACQCNRVGRLVFMMPDFIDAAGLLGLFSISTHSLYDILGIHRYLSTIEGMHGRLTGIPFVFGRAGKEVSMPSYKDASKRTKQTKSLLYIHVDEDFTRNQLLPTLGQPAVAAGSSVAQLPSGQVIDPDTGEVLDDIVPEMVEDEATVIEDAPEDLSDMLSWSTSDTKKFVESEVKRLGVDSKAVYSHLLMATNSKYGKKTSDMLTGLTATQAQELVNYGKFLADACDNYQDATRIAVEKILIQSTDVQVNTGFDAFIALANPDARKKVLDAKFASNPTSEPEPPAPKPESPKAKPKPEPKPSNGDVIVPDSIIEVETVSAGKDQIAHHFHTAFGRIAIGTRDMFLLSGLINGDDWTEIKTHKLMTPVPVKLIGNDSMGWAINQIEGVIAN